MKLKKFISLVSFSFLALNFLSSPVENSSTKYVKAELAWNDPSEESFANDWTYTDYKTYYANYASLAKGSGSELKTKLFNKISSHTSISYGNLWDQYGKTDVYPGTSKIWDMYSSSSSFTASTNQCGTYRTEGNCYNREHSLPKSWFSEATPMYTDLFHVVPTDGYVNGRRNNYPFGEVGTASYSSSGGFSKLGTSSYSGYSGTVFEPNDEYKGDFARIYFYMVTAYESVVSGWTTSNTNMGGNSYPGLNSWSTEMLLKWALEDPISQKEIDRNEAVYQVQKNRNPYVDNKSFVCRVFGPYSETTKSLCAAANEPVSSVSINEGSTYIIDNYDSHQFNVTVLPDNANNKKVTWSISDETLGTISETGLFVAKKPGQVTITATSQENDTILDTCIITINDVPYIPITSLQFKESVISIGINDTYQLSVSYSPSNATDKTIMYYANNPGICDVSETGLITPRATGETTIVAYAGDGDNYCSTECTLKVTTYSPINPTDNYQLLTDINDLQSGDKIVIAQNTKNVVAGDVSNSYLSSVSGVQFSTDNSEITSLPSTAEIFTVNSSNGSYTLANSANGLLGSSAAKNVCWGSGTTTWTISIDSSNNATIQNTNSSYGRFLYNNTNPRFTTYTSNTSASMLLPQIYYLPSGSVVNKTLSGLSYTGTPKLDYTIGDAFDPSGLVVTATYDNGSPSVVTDKVTWSSLSIDSTSVTGSYTENGVTKTIVISGITVNPRLVSSLDVSLGSSSIAIGNSTSITVSILPSEASNKNVSIVSLNTNIASINGNSVLGISRGEVTIRVSTLDGSNISKDVSLTIYDPNIYTNVDTKIIKAKDLFKEVRADVSDLSSINQAIIDASNTYDSLYQEEKDLVTNSNYLTALQSAYDFMTMWYQDIRIAVNDNTRAIRYSICDAINNNNGALMKSAIDTYNSLSTDTQEILRNTYDITGDDGSIVTIGDSIKYASAVINLGDSFVPNSETTSLIVRHSSPKIIIAIISVIALFIISSFALCISLIRKNRKVSR